MKMVKISVLSTAIKEALVKIKNLCGNALWDHTFIMYDFIVSSRSVRSCEKKFSGEYKKAALNIAKRIWD